MGYVPSPSYSITVRVEIENRIGMFAKIASAISGAGGDLGSIDIVKVEKGKIIRDITVNARDEEHEKKIIRALKHIEGVKILRVMDRTFLVHEGGKIGIYNKVNVKGREDLSRVYTPGVARVCLDIQKNPEHVYRYTIKGNTVAVITDGTAVLGLGNIGAEAAMPVMEGKCMLFKEFGSVDAFPIAIKTTDVDEFVNIVKKISTPFGGINLEDIAAPRCFEIEKRLREELNIPVIHDDQHGTAIVVLAALINVGRVLKKEIKDFKIVIAGAGAAGTATAYMLLDYGVKDIIVCDRAGTLYEGRKEEIDPYKEELARKTNPRKIKGKISDALEGADVFIGLSAPNIVTPDDIKKMNPPRIVFALANPDPEIAPELAMPLVRIMATGRSDYPNQINNVLAFPGLFKGLLEVKARGVDKEIFFAASHAIANIIKDEELNEDYIIPSIFNKKVAQAVANAVSEKAKKLKLAR
ncbi:MAG: NAD-dependent malic enzyme [Thermodesulfovibrio sp.]|uniref:NAD-dependent malic enzyme n=1 Tax=Thermodesulfovibrio sp. 1176 TaxID=3043424 RepID=UPI002482A2D5|nr:NAD-dependent malic enzyme [Thermodesulfovibrio sp. 1176]MDI1472265.1 NAD-dependent malic enzyme [Thermodesulfovibrio sp. 1176]MDI6714127.1 NAD-dependent malic enzyme [Thermodesulfovibrio sp.]